MCPHIFDIAIDLCCKPNSPLALDHDPNPRVLAEAFLTCDISDRSRQHGGDLERESGLADSGSGRQSPQVALRCLEALSVRRLNINEVKTHYG
jgi:hypothetical protein